ncbi:MAG: molybdate ABC transporter substrate-binding protein [Jannaschia sp.]
MMVSPTPFDRTRRAVLGAGVLALLARPLRAERDLTVMAAASLKPALDEIAGRWAEPVVLSYGGSGTIARQAALGAPADLIVLAATDWMDWLAGQGVLSTAPRSVATNRLVLAGPPNVAPLRLRLPDVIEALGPGGRLAMGDPASVPAGRYGQQALETLGLWAALRPRAILTEDVRAALAYVARGDVAMGLVYRSDTVGTGVGTAALVPATAHAPIVYPAALLAGAGPGAPAFLEHLADNGDVFAAHGFAA